MQTIRRGRMTIALSRDVGAQLIELLGLPKNTVRFDVRFEVNKPVEIQCIHYPDKEAANQLNALLSSQFTLAPRMEDVTTLSDQSRRYAPEPKA